MVYLDFSLPSTSKSNPKSVTIELLKSPFKSPKITQISDGLKPSLNQQTGLMTSIAEEGSVNIDDLRLIRETVRGTSKKVKTDNNPKLKNQLHCTQRLCFHWDSKIITEQEKVVLDRLAVLISGVKGFKEENANNTKTL
ncbi:hypothetical protein AVEN_191062-1 [Araneus ventricosus]|uniref:Uncharacterized protein n=1 Tax=Araneus ventricosus TaxID=182803 RepID=A0A4Y2AZT8_ARAVE|nr:hypothetical protein AVEN_191062-1 [Araneus ventricosus]